MSNLFKNGIPGMVAGAPQMNAQVTVVPLAAVRKTLLDTRALLANLQSQALTLAATVAQQLATVKQSEQTMRQISLIGSPIDKSGFAGEAEAECLSAAYSALEQIASLCRELEGVEKIQ